jgi:hypothetical protein
MSAVKGLMQTYTTILDSIDSRFVELESKRDAYLDAKSKNELARKTAFQFLTMTFTAITQNSLPLSATQLLNTLKQQPLTEPIKTFALDARRRVLGFNQRLITICDSLGIKERVGEEESVYSKLKIKDFKLILAMNAKLLREIAGEEKPSTSGGAESASDFENDFIRYGLLIPQTPVSSPKIRKNEEIALLQELETPTVGGKARRGRPRATKKRI